MRLFDLKPNGFRVGAFAAWWCWSRVNYGFSINQWHYFQQRSWLHGNAYLWKLKLVW